MPSTLSNTRINPDLTPNFGFAFSEFYDREGLKRLDSSFLDFLNESDAILRTQLNAARDAPDAMTDRDRSALIVALAPHLEDFLARLFRVEAQVQALAEHHHELAPLYSCKRLFVQRRAMTKIKADEAAAIDGPDLEAELALLFGKPFSELTYAQHVNTWLRDEIGHADNLQLALRYAAWSVQTQSGQWRHEHGILFKLPAKLDFDHLVPLREVKLDGIKAYRHAGLELRRREGFKLTDAGTDLTGALDQANYCIWCHEQNKDSCSKGLKEKPPADGRDAAFKKNVFGVKLAGCPLEEKISEFHKVKTEGYALGALAIIAIDNPMVAASGHRICNDCMKSCIYQKQQPVDIPQAETRSLKDVLDLPWGFEIYSLLTRWNPLNFHRPYPKAPTGRRVLIVGMGPAGYSLAHQLMNDGHTVVGIDGLKIEPLPTHIGGVTDNGERVLFAPIRAVADLYESLDERVLAGFGGVAEYGITVRWNKNFLKLIRLLLERRSQFALFGGVRFGGTLNVDSAWTMGFDHIALANGAGRPTVLDIPNGLARGVRTASDFLMALQLTGAAKRDSIANLQLRLPVVVIGGGLTAIDTATESLAYYPVQVEKFLHRYRTLVAEKGEAEVRQPWAAEELQVADEFLGHAIAIEAERQQAIAEGREARIAELLQSWGGVTIAYRKRLIESPSYTLNHEEIAKALEEGISFGEALKPERIEVDEFGAVRAIRVSLQRLNDEGMWVSGNEIDLAARSILVAAGTQPNTVLAREDPLHFVLDGRYFQACDEAGNAVKPESAISKPKQAQVLLAKHSDGRYISYFGDVHPSFFGNVVKAMGSAKQGYPTISAVLNRVAPASILSDEQFIAMVNAALRATVHEIIRLTPNIVEVIIKAPMAARSFRPGQFYRLQNYDRNALQIDGTRLAMEGLALTGAWVDPQRGLISTIVLEMGGSANLCAMLKPGEPVVLMGPTGSPTEIPAGQTVTLVGGGLGNAVLFSIGQALREAGSTVLYFAGYKKMIDRYKITEIEKAADVVIWCCDEQPGFVPGRIQDRSFVGNIVQAMLAYANGTLGSQAIPFSDTDRIVAIGSDTMMSAVATARHTVLKAYINPDHVAIGSINSPMQCMMKEICAQCLQTHIDPETGNVTRVFSCFDQDQPLDCVDFPGLKARLRQNSVQEKLTAQWIERSLKQLQLRPSTK
ncbi:MAG: FAD-dependent oxidoreductase [Gallionella sp.]